MRRIPIVASLVAVTAALLALPAEAEAQRRAGVRVRGGGAVGVTVVRPRVYVSAYRYSPYFYAYDPWFYDSWAYGYAQRYPVYGYRYDDSASLRLQVTPRETEVFVDGYFAGTVDDFDGMLQRLHLEPGDHDVELYLPGHGRFVQRVYLQPTKTFRIRHEMVPLGPGDPPAVRPTGGPIPERRDDQDYPPPRRGTGPAGNREPPRGGTAAAGFGSLALRVQPGDAEVLIDGEPWQGGAQDERLVVQLGAGTHRIEIRKTGYRTYLTDVTVRPGETTPLNVAMTRSEN